MPLAIHGTLIGGLLHTVQGYVQEHTGTIPQNHIVAAEHVIQHWQLSTGRPFHPDQIKHGPEHGPYLAERLHYTGVRNIPSLVLAGPFGSVLVIGLTQAISGDNKLLIPSKHWSFLTIILAVCQKLAMVYGLSSKSSSGSTYRARCGTSERAVSRCLVRRIHRYSQAVHHWILPYSSQRVWLWISIRSIGCKDASSGRSFAQRHLHTNTTIASYL